jgi:hypothetical protein
MSEDITAIAGEPSSDIPADGVKEFTPPQSQEDLNKIIEARLARERAKYADHAELQKAAERLAEIEDRDKSELQKANERTEQAERKALEAEQRATEKEREFLVAQIATAKKVPAKYLQGATAEELTASADEFLADIQAIAPDRKPGVVPSAGTGDPKPEVSSLDTGRARAQALIQNNS